MATIGMGFSTAQDADVRAYKQLRAQILAQEQARRDAAKAARARELHREASSLKGTENQGGALRRFFCRRKAVSVGGSVVLAKKLEEDSDFESEDEYEEVDIKTVLKQ